MQKNVIAHTFNVTIEQRSAMKKQNPLLLWFTGLSGSGKSTIANAVETALFNKGVHTYSLDGDNVRLGLNSNLTFSAEDRKENIRRIAEVSKLMIDAGLVVIASFVSPYREDRAAVRDIITASRFVEIYINTSLEECEKRDVKGLYKKARAGEIKNFTGINAPYEAPVNTDIEIDTLNTTVEEAVDIIIQKIERKIVY